MTHENGPSPHLPKRPYVTEILSLPYDKQQSISLENIAWETAISRPILDNITIFIRNGYRGSVTVADILPDPDSMEQTVEQRDMIAYVFRLSKNHTLPHAQDVLQLRYQEGLGLEETGERLGITVNIVRIVEKRAIYKLQALIQQLEHTKEKHGNTAG
jgi:RNA polymerase sigma factor (sigma-70 family)